MAASLGVKSAGTRSWRVAAVHRGLEPVSRGIAIVRSRYQTTTSEAAADWRRLSVIL
jgi:hypothetical protein